MSRVLFTAWLRSICNIGVISSKSDILYNFQLEILDIGNTQTRHFCFSFHKGIFQFPSGASLTAFLRGHFISKFSRIACWSQRFQTILTTNVNWNSSTRDMIFMQTETQFSSHCSVSSLVIFLFRVSTVNLVGSPLLSYSL